MKGQVWTYAGIVIVILLSSFALIKINATGNVKRVIASSEGKLIAFENYAEFIIKMLNISIEFISQRSAYELGETGGLDGNMIATWNKSYPSIEILESQLENKISENLPNKPIGDGRSISWGDATVDVLDYENAICGPIESSKCFVVDGNESFSIYERSIDSRITMNPYKFNQKIASNYFRLLNAGRAIMEDSRFNTKFYDMTILLNEINSAKASGDSRFKDLDFSIIPVLTNMFEITIVEKCYPSKTYCLAPLKAGETGEISGVPYDFLRLKFNVAGALGDFIISVSPSSQSITQGNPITPAINVIGFSINPVALSVSGCPAGATCSIAPNSGVPAFSSTLTITNAPVGGPYTMTITGDNGTVSHQVTYALTVTPPCIPKTCAQLGKNCEDWSNDCGGTVNCGTCPALQKCNNGVCCTPKTCAQLGKNCGGPWDDGCGGTIGSCGTCSGSTPNCNNGVCSAPPCVPKTCVQLGKNCDIWSDGCSGTVNCGSCTLPNVCNNGVCTCTPTTCAALGKQCGWGWSDGCGGTLSCGSCTGGKPCNANGQCCDTCASLGKQCGWGWPDGCSGTLSCGSCTGGKTCNNNGQCCDTCASLGKNCGSWPDGCGGTTTCSCPHPSDKCNADGTCTCICTGGILCGTCYLGNALGEKRAWYCDNNGQWVPDQCGTLNLRKNCACPLGYDCDAPTGKCTCKCSDSITPMNSCSLTDANKPNWCDNNCVWLLSQCGSTSLITRHNCGCRSGYDCDFGTGNCIPSNACRWMTDGLCLCSLPLLPGNDLEVKCGPPGCTGTCDFSDRGTPCCPGDPPCPTAPVITCVS